MDAELFERKYIEHIADMLDKSGVSYSDFARKVFPDQGNPEGKWRRLRNGHMGKFPSLGVADAVRMSEALGENYPSLVWQVSQLIR